MGLRMVQVHALPEERRYPLLSLLHVTSTQRVNSYRRRLKAYAGALA